MNIKEVYILMEKYFDGNTSLDEEQKLRNFFSEFTTDIPDELLVYQALFCENKSESIPVLDRTFTENIWQQIEQKNTKTKVVSIQAFKWLLTAAASLILMLSVYQWYGKREYKQFIAAHNQQEMTKEEALLATKQALAFVSIKLNEGRRPIKNVGSFYRFQNKIKNNKNENISKDIHN